MAWGGKRPGSGRPKLKGSIDKKIRRCRFCQKIITVKSKQYCSKQCIKQARGIFPIERKCKHCGKLWIDDRSKSGQKRYCSDECRMAVRRKYHRKKAVKCQRCGKIFMTQQSRSKYCSAKCVGAVLSERRKARRPSYTCKKCGKSFSRVGGTTRADSYLYCSRKCAGVGEMGSSIKTKDRRIGNHRRRAKYYGVSYETVIPVEVFRRDNWHCQICGKITPEKNRGTRYPNAPELDHRIPLSIGGDHSYDNVQCACRICNVVKSNKNSVGQFPLFQVRAS